MALCHGASESPDLNAISKLILRRFAGAARPYLESQGLFLTSKPFSRSALVWTPGGEKVVVLAPHMDDETIGCGGTLALHVRAGAEVAAVFLTDGRHGTSSLAGLSGEARRREEQALVARRKDEARAALAKLGVADVLFLDVEDGTLAASTEVVRRLRQALERLRPEIVYVPSFLEEHPDHRAASRVLVEAARGSRLRFDCFAYEVWTPLFPNCLVRIDDVTPTKEAALREYETQLAQFDYVRTALALNAFRSIGFTNGYGRFAEAFAVTPVEEYRRLFEAYSAGAIRSAAPVGAGTCSERPVPSGPV